MISVALAVATGVFLAVAVPAAAEVSLAAYVVTFDGPPTSEQLETLSGIALGVHGFRHLPAAVAVAAPTDLRVLANLPGVRRVYPNRRLVKMLRQSTRTIRADAAWDLGFTGAGIGVAVIDTGIDGTHPDLCARPEFCRGTAVKTVQNVKIIGRESLADPVVVIEDQVNTDTTSGHGTHVAGIAAGLGVASAYEAGRYRGVAHGARLIGLGTGELIEVDAVLAGYDWVIEHRDDPRYNIKVINNSWGPGPGFGFDPEDPVQRATAAAHAAGLSVVFGAGNNGPSTDTLNAFSANPKAISVAAGTKAGHISFFSSRGVPGSDLWHPTVTAPGQFIASARASTGFVSDVADALSPNPDPIIPPDDVFYATGNGTSMAAPHVAGVIALVQEASFASRGRYLTPDEVKNLLQNTAVSRDAGRGPGGLPNYQAYTMGAGYADALAAVQATLAGTGTTPYDDGVSHDVRAFSGTIGPAAFFSIQSFSTTFDVASGAISLDVMADWEAGANDVDIDLFDPAGTRVRSTAFQCDPGAEPNGFSSFCTGIPNERITILAPAAGTWRAVVHGTLSAVDTVTGVWSAAHPDGTPLPPAPAPASVTVAPASATGVAGKGVDLVATVRDAGGNAVPNATVVWASAGVGGIVRAETLTHADGTAQATALSDSPGTQSVTATSGGASGSSTITWVGVSLPGPPSTPGRASGGGWILDSDKRTFGFFAEFQVGASGPAGDLSFNDHAGTKVKAAGVEQLVVVGSGATITGPATVNGSAGFRYRLEVVDNGSGRTDTFRLVVTSDADAGFRYESGGTLAGGNLTVSA